MLKADGIVAVDDWRTEQTPGVTLAVLEQVAAGELHAIAITRHKFYGVFEDSLAAEVRRAVTDWAATDPGMEVHVDPVRREQWPRIGAIEPPTPRRTLPRKILSRLRRNLQPLLVGKASKWQLKCRRNRAVRDIAPRVVGQRADAPRIRCRSFARGTRRPSPRFRRRSERRPLERAVRDPAGDGRLRRGVPGRKEEACDSPGRPPPVTRASTDTHTPAPPTEARSQTATHT
jgi:hypothetical protein